jgi:transcriptional regulator PpsR
MTSRGTRYWNSGSIPLIVPEVLGNIIATAGDISIVISDVGQILSALVNPTHQRFGSLDHWEGRDIRDFLTVESIPKLEAQIAAFSTGDEINRGIELNHSDDHDWEFPVRYTLHRIGHDGSLLMIGRDLRPIAEIQQQLVQAQMSLERDYEAQRENDTRFRVLMETIHEAVMFVSIASGKILDMNRAASTMLGVSSDDFKKVALTSEFELTSKGDLLEELSSVATADTKKLVELVAKKSKRKFLAVPSVFRAGGERVLLCQLDGAGASPQSQDELTDNLSSLYNEGVDAIVFTDDAGIIRTANESFLNLAGIAEISMAKGKPLSDFLARGTIDTKVLIDNAKKSGHMRLYSTKVTSDFAGQTPVEMSVSFLEDANHPALAFVFRDASRSEPGQRTTTMPDDGGRSVMELVGSATLKEIVRGRNARPQPSEPLCETA